MWADVCGSCARAHFTQVLVVPRGLGILRVPGSSPSWELTKPLRGRTVYEGLEEEVKKMHVNKKMEGKEHVWTQNSNDI